MIVISVDQEFAANNQDNLHIIIYDFIAEIFSDKN